MSMPIITVQSVSKKYKLGQLGGTTLKEELQRRHARRLNKPDPTKKIGSRDYEYGEEFLALNNVSFDVYKGERVGLIGHNGAGKSTMLKLLSRITAPSSGCIGLNGRVAFMLEVGTGFHGELTGRENIYMNGAILGMSKKEIDGKINRIIEFSECEQFIDTPVKRYSSGMFVKLAFSVAAHLDAEIMIMDEVLAVGDMAFQEKCLNKMNEISREEGRTIIYVSHNMSTIRKLCERCIVLQEGKKVLDSDVETGVRKYLLVEDIESDVSIDLSKRKHYKDVDYSCIELKQINILEKDTPFFRDNELLKLRIVFENCKPVDNLMFRISVSAENGNILGTSWSNHISVEKCGDHSAIIEFPLSSFPKGVYYFDIGYCQKRKDGKNDTLDYIFNAFKLEIMQKIDAESLIWYPTHWGARLPNNDMRLVE